MMFDRFYPIVDSCAWLERLVPLGVKLIQLRIKDTADDVLAREVAKAKLICDRHDCMLVVNDYWQVAIETGCKFVHLGQEDLDSADIKAIRSAGVKIGISTHDHDELDRAMTLAPDYVALGPIYPTILKKMKWHEQGLDRLSEWRELVSRTPLVAIGGFSLERAQGAFDAGADIVSAVTDITLNPTPEQRTLDWIAVTRATE